MDSDHLAGASKPRSQSPLRPVLVSALTEEDGEGPHEGDAGGREGDALQGQGAVTTAATPTTLHLPLDSQHFQQLLRVLLGTVDLRGKEKRSSNNHLACGQ